jgi:hypothetical protein
VADVTGAFSRNPPHKFCICRPYAKPWAIHQQTVVGSHISLQGFIVGPVWFGVYITDGTVLPKEELRASYRPSNDVKECVLHSHTMPDGPLFTMACCVLWLQEKVTFSSAW